MKADKRKKIIDEITRLNPKNGLTFTSLSGKALKRALAHAKNVAVQTGAK